VNRTGFARRRAPVRVDIAVSHPHDGRMLVTSRYFFADPTADVCRRLARRLFEVKEVRAVDVHAAGFLAQIEYANGSVPRHVVVAKIARHLRAVPNGHGVDDGHAVGDLPPALGDGVEGWRVERHGPVLSTWEIVHELPGRIRLRNRLIRRDARRCAAIDATLARVTAIYRHVTNPVTATVLVEHDPGMVSRRRLLDVLERALTEPGPARPRTLARVDEEPGRAISSAERTHAGKEMQWSRHEFAISAASMCLAAVGDTLYPALGPLSVPGAAYSSLGLYVSGIRAVTHEHTISVDTLLILIQIASVMAGYYFLFSLNNFVYQYARSLLQKIKHDSRADYTDFFLRDVRTVRLLDGREERDVPLSAVKVGDLVSIAAGQTVPVDGCVARGAATVDQHLLTGEAVPAEKGVGDQVFASTVALSGSINVRVEKTGAATTAAQIARLLSNTVDFKTGRQLRAERVSDRLIWPALLSAAAAWPLVSASAGAALLDAHPKYRTTLASSLGLLNYFRLAAREGLLVKDGRALELLTAVDTVVFDKTGTLTLDLPHVRRVHARAPHTGADILRLAAAAEQHQSHPVARAILDAARARGLSVDPIDEAEYRVGYGLTVRVDRHVVSVGSMRFIESEGIAIPPAVTELQARCHGEGHALLLVSHAGEVAGAIELHVTVRPEARRIVRGLRERGIGSIYIISGDHETPTRRLAESLGIERYFAETLPGDKASLIEGLQRSGHVVCYVGDGINDSIAMKTSHVSVSLRGASTLAVDTAEVVLLDQSLNALCRLFDIARECDRNTTVTMAACFLPSLVCVAGVLLGYFGFAEARLFNVAGLVGGVGAAMLPRATHRAPTPQSGTRSPLTGPDAATIEEHVLA
jgi:heavy metal translocating P-type ATPase